MANCEWCDAPVPLGDVAYSRHPDPHDCIVILRCELARVTALAEERVTSLAYLARGCKRCGHVNATHYNDATEAHNC